MTKIATANSPSRATLTGTMQVGLLNLPCKIYTGTESVAISRSRFSPAGNKVRQVNVDPETGDVIDRDALVMKAQTSDGRWVEFTDAEADKFTPVANKVFHVSQFVTRDEAYDSFVARGCDQIRFDVTVAKVWAVVAQAMIDTDTMALVQWTARGRSKMGLLASDGTLREVAFANEVRADRDTTSADYTDAELAMATQLVQHMTNDAVAIEDTGAAEARAYLDAKASTEGVAALPEPKVMAQEAVDSLLDALAAASTDAAAKKVG